MKPSLFRVSLLVTGFCTLAPLAVRAQQLDLPRPSPSAKVTQTLGLTDVTVEYSSPAVKGRKIWGALLPYDQVWRTGANAATKITFSKDLTFGGKPVAAGTYSLMTIPGKANWTVILNKNPAGSPVAPKGSPNEYKESDDVARVQVKPQTAPARERLAFLFSDFDDAGGNLSLEWEKVRVSVPLKVDTEGQTRAAIAAMSDNAWQPWNQAARYMLDKKDYDAGLKLVEQSLALKEDWFNDFTKAQLSAGKGDFKTAYTLAQKANDLGQQKPQAFFLAEQVKQALTDWKGK
jgi:hypothetical protein